MHVFRPRRLIPLTLALCVACGGGSPDPAGPARAADIRIDGSSTVFMLTEAVAEEFQKVHRDARVTVGQSGSGGGFQKFCRADTDISNASRPIRPSEIDACRAQGIEFVELPVAFDGIAIVAHPKAAWINEITVDELRRIWAPEAQRTVMRWSQVRQGWPDREIHLFGAGVDSGTYDYFTEAVVEQSGASRGDFTSSEDDNVLVQGVAGDELALAFLPFAYYVENSTRLKLIPVDNGRADDGDGPVAPNVETIRAGTYQPLARPLFIYVSRTSLDRPEVARLVEFYLAHAGELAEEVGYVQLGDAGYALVRDHLKTRRTGTVFGEEGAQVGMTIEQLLARERR
jgi:phosphate transport system substrate-binding protein